ncbi:hypothetical protein ACWGE0_31635 [Lentzea sp. NPDC054927]
MTRSGVASAPATSAPRTDANACSCSPGLALAPPRMLPTPQARDGDNRGAADPVRRRQLGHQVSLHDAVNSVIKVLPTPTASDAKACAHKNQKGGPSLGDECRTVQNASSHNTSTNQLVFLPTPRATDGTKGCPAQRGSKGDLMLPSAIIRLLSQGETENAA